MENALTPAASAPIEKVPATRAQFIKTDDKDMLRAARDLTKDLGEAKASIYWTDM